MRGCRLNLWGLPHCSMPPHLFMYAQICARRGGSGPPALGAPTRTHTCMPTVQLHVRLNLRVKCVSSGDFHRNYLAKWYFSSNNNTPLHAMRCNSLTPKLSSPLTQGVVLKGIFPQGGGDAKVRLVAGTWDSGVSSSLGDGGRAVSASLAFPKGIAVDGNDAVYVAEYNGGKVRKITPGGAISTSAGTGEKVGTAANLRDMLTERWSRGYIFLRRGGCTDVIHGRSRMAIEGGLDGGWGGGGVGSGRGVDGGRGREWRWGAGFGV